MYFKNKQTIKHLDLNKTYRLGEKGKKNKRTGTSIWDTRVSSYAKGNFI